MRRLSLLAVFFALGLLLTGGGCAPAQPAAAPPAATTQPAAPTKVSEVAGATAAVPPTTAATPMAAPTTAPATTAGATLGPGPKVSIEMVGQPIPTQMQYSRVELPYARDIIPQRSGGRVEVQIGTASERGLAGTEIIRLVRQGQVDIAELTLTIVSGDVPLLDGADLIGLNPTIGQARQVFNALLPEANSDLEKFGVKIIGSVAYPAQVFFCRQPVKDLADLRGRKIRTRGPADNDFVNYIGAQPVSVAFAEVYSALERGVVDCGITGTGAGNDAKWYEVTSHMYTLPLAWATGAYVVNLSWWNQLDPDVRSFLEATFKEIEDKQWELAAVLTQDGIDCNTASPGCRLGNPDTASPMVEVKPLDADKALVKKALEEVIIPAWVKRAGPRAGEVYNRLIAPISGVTYVPR